jgi:hypothetical protein
MLTNVNQVKGLVIRATDGDSLRIHECHTHYGRPPYWLQDAEHKAALSLSGV